MLNVAIAVDTDTDYGNRAVQVIASACEEVIGEQRCPVASELEPGTVAAWYAVVHPNDRALSSVRIEFRDRTADGVLIEERVLTFGARDSQKSRLASVGSVIAALAAAREGSPIHPLRHEAIPEPVAPPAAPPPPPPADWAIDGVALVAPTFGDGPYRLGALARLHAGLYGPSFALASVGYSEHSGNPSFAWWTLSAGVGTRVGDRASSFDLEFRGELVFEHTGITVERGSQQDSAGQSGWGARVGVDAVWATWRHCALIWGVDGTLVLPRISVVVADEEPAHVPSANVALLLGLRFQP